MDGIKGPIENVASEVYPPKHSVVESILKRCLLKGDVCCHTYFPCVNQCFLYCGYSIDSSIVEVGVINSSKIVYPPHTANNE